MLGKPLGNGGNGEAAVPPGAALPEGLGAALPVGCALTGGGVLGGGVSGAAVVATVGGTGVVDGPAATDGVVSVVTVGSGSVMTGGVVVVPITYAITAPAPSISATTASPMMRPAPPLFFGVRVFGGFVSGSGWASCGPRASACDRAACAACRSSGAACAVPLPGHCALTGGGGPVP